MSKGFQASISIERPLETVWAIMTDFGRAPEWMPGIETVTAKDEMPLGSGKVFETEISTAGRGRRRAMTLTLWDPKNHVFALSSSEGSVTAVYRYALQECGESTLVTLDAACQSSSFVMRLMAPLIVFMMARHDRRQMPLLKVFVEREGA